MRLKISLTSKIFIAVALGLLAGLIFPESKLDSFSAVGKMFIHWVKLAAGPYLLLSILASVLEVKVAWLQGLKLMVIAVLNTAVAIGVGIVLSITFLKDVQLSSLSEKLVQAKAVVSTPAADLSISGWTKTLMPKSLLEPILSNDILLLALLGLLVGIAMRKAIEQRRELSFLVLQVESLRDVMQVLLGWVINIMPIAVFLVIAGSVSEYGFGMFVSLSKFVAVVFMGFAIQVVFVYGFWNFVVAKINAKKLWAAVKDPILYAIGVNSSLATLPLTLKALHTLGVSKQSATLGAGVATNLNNDGIVLYEAAAVFFVASLYQVPLEPLQMVLIALTCMVAALGIAGVPEAGFVSLTVVIAAVHLPPEALPLLLSVDWVIARGRTVVNVLSDMTLAIALDAVNPLHAKRVAN
jgi:Na+/H+-dicarboxylate symporter